MFFGAQSVIANTISKKISLKAATANRPRTPDNTQRSLIQGAALHKTLIPHGISGSVIIKRGVAYRYSIRLTGQSHSTTTATAQQRIHSLHLLTHRLRR